MTILNDISLHVSLIYSTQGGKVHGRFVEMPGVLPARMP